jgi:hypothetical protein
LHSSRAHHAAANPPRCVCYAVVPTTHAQNKNKSKQVQMHIHQMKDSGMPSQKELRARAMAGLVDPKVRAWALARTWHVGAMHAWADSMPKIACCPPAVLASAAKERAGGREGGSARRHFLREAAQAAARCGRAPVCACACRRVVPLRGCTSKAPAAASAPGGLRGANFT